MAYRARGVRSRGRSRTAGAVLCLWTAIALPGQPASADSQGEAKQRVALAAGELEASTEAVRRAAVRLSAISAQLPTARRKVALATGELAGARALVAGATRKVSSAELATGAAQRKVDEARARVEQGRDTIGGLARRSYQQGPLGDLREIFRAGSPQDLVDRAETLKKVFRGQNDVLHDLSVDRLRLTTTTAELGAKQKELEAARDVARAGEERAEVVARRAQQAAARVEDLVAERASALATARSERAADEAAYRAANEASRALAARLRAAAKARALAAARARTQAPRVSSGRFAWPADGPMTSPFGYRTHPIYGDRRFHAGVDIGAGDGNGVWSASGGTVVQAGPAGGYGNFVVVSHGTFGGRDIVTTYAHMSSISVVAGQRVGRGQEVGRVGSTGNVTGPHLHFEVRRDGDPVDPVDWVTPP